MYDSIIVLSHLLTPTNELSEESILRMDKCISLYYQNLSKYIVINAGLGKIYDISSENNNSNSHKIGSVPLHTKIMKNYFIKHGINENNVLVRMCNSKPFVETYDTVGEAYFIKQSILLPNNLKKNVVVTSSYHIERSELVYNKILGPEFKTLFIGVPSPLDSDLPTLNNEKKSIVFFTEQFGDVVDGDSRTIEEILYSKHGIYSKLEFEKQEKFFK